MEMDYSTGSFIGRPARRAHAGERFALLRERLRAAMPNHPGIEAKFSRKIAGYATRYYKAHAYRGVIDVFAPGCFQASLAAKNLVRFCEDHEQNRAIATTNGGGLDLRSDEAGLAFLATLPADAMGDRAYELVKSHRKNAMSVSYQILDYEIKELADAQVRFIKNVNLTDVSLCSTGVLKEAFAQVVDPSTAEPQWMTPAHADWAGAAAQFLHALSRASELCRP